MFVQYAEDVENIFRHHRVHHHLFADDMQGYSSGRLDDAPAIVSRLKAASSTSMPDAVPNVYSSTPTG